MPRYARNLCLRWHDATTRFLYSSSAVSTGILLVGYVIMDSSHVSFMFFYILIYRFNILNRAVNVFLAYRTIGGYLKRRRGRICILRPKIMFKLSGDPVVVAFRSRNSVNLNDHHTEFGDVDNLQSNETSV